MTDLASQSLNQEELFPIREVSRLTGVNPVTLRAWERRYGLIQPTRTESGHRLYSLADIDAVQEHPCLARAWRGGEQGRQDSSSAAEAQAGCGRTAFPGSGPERVG
jgi:hypothetical protein